MHERPPGISDETWHGQNRHELEALGDAIGYGAEVRIGSFDSDSSYRDRAKQELAASVDGLMELFGVAPERWQDAALELRMDNRSTQPYFREWIQERGAGKSLAECLLHW